MEFPITNEFIQEEAKTIQDGKRMLVLANRILAQQGIFDAFGHISLRNPEDPNTFLITRSLSPELVTMDDILTLDFNGDIVSQDKTQKTFLERFIHCSIYKARPDVNCVAHPHPPEIITFIATGAPYGSIYHLDVTFHDGIPLFTDIPVESGALINSMAVADKLTETLGKKRGVMIRNHGIVIVGESIPRVIYSTITLRDNIRMLLPAIAAGAKPVYIDRESAEYGTKTHFCGSPFKRCWDYWNSLAKKTYEDIAHLEH